MEYRCHAATAPAAAGAFAGLCGSGCRCCALLAALFAPFFSLGSRLRKERGIALKTCQGMGAVVHEKKTIGSTTRWLWTLGTPNRLRLTKRDAFVVGTWHFESAPSHRVLHSTNTYTKNIMSDNMTNIAVGLCSDIKVPCGANADAVYFIGPRLIKRPQLSGMRREIAL